MKNYLDTFIDTSLNCTFIRFGLVSKPNKHLILGMNKRVFYRFII